MVNRFFRAIFKDGIIRVLPVILLLAISGCGDFFEKKSTELETRKILSELEQVREIPSVTNPLPEMYRGGSKRVHVKDGTKLLYFTRNHTVDKLANLIKQQLGHKVDQNPATNQLIIHCPDDAQADKVLEFLALVDVPPIQVNIDCLVLERFADMTMDWETTILLENFLGEGITLGKSKFPDAAFPGAALRESKRAEFGLDFGYWRNEGKSGHQFRAMVDMLISRGYLKVLMNPQLETINGQKAKIVSRENAPLEKIVAKEGVDPYSLTEYQWVEDALEVTPHVFADGSVGLETNVKIGSRSKPEGVVQVSIITERSVDVSENRIAPGDSLVIGGLRKSEKRSIIRGIPFFKDLPVVGVLFSSKDFEEKATEIIFILTPSISSGGVKYAKMAEDISKKHEILKPAMGVQEALTDPFGAGIYIKVAEEQAREAQFEKLKSEIEKAEALGQVDLAKKKLLEVVEQLEEEKAKAQKAQAEAKKARHQAEQAQKQAQAAAEQAKKAKEEAEQAKQRAKQAEKQKSPPVGADANQPR